MAGALGLGWQDKQANMVLQVLLERMQDICHLHRGAMRLDHTSHEDTRRSSRTTTPEVASRAPTRTVRALDSMAVQTTVKLTADAVTTCLVAPIGFPGLLELPRPTSLSAT